MAPDQQFLACFGLHDGLAARDDQGRDITAGSKYFLGYVVQVYEMFSGSDFIVMAVGAGHGATSEEYYVGCMTRPING